MLEIAASCWFSLSPAQEEALTQNLTWTAASSCS